MSKHTATTATAPAAFEPEFIALLKDLFEDKIVFNRVLGLRLQDITPERVTARIDMKPDLIGHYQHGRVHGGVVSGGWGLYRVLRIFLRVRYESAETMSRETRPLGESL